MTLREFRRTPIYDAFYRGILDHWLDFGLAAAPTRTRVFIFERRNRPDFDERDRLVADLLQPHLTARAEAAETALRGAAALAALEEGASEDASGVVLCGRKGVIEFASPSSRAVLERYLGIENGRVPLAVLGRRKIRLAHADRRLDVRIAQTDNLHVLVLDERDTRIESSRRASGRSSSMWRSAKRTTRSRSNLGSPPPLWRSTSSTFTGSSAFQTGPPPPRASRDRELWDEALDHASLAHLRRLRAIQRTGC